MSITLYPPKWNDALVFFCQTSCDKPQQNVEILNWNAPICIWRWALPGPAGELEHSPST